MERFRYGDVLLDEASILRRPPHFVRPDQLLALEAIVWSTDMLEAAYHDACDVGLRLSQKMDFGRRDRAAMLSNVWVMVDQLHALRQLMPLLTQRGEDRSKLSFFKLSQPVYRLRNAMDHLASKLNNLSKKKATGPLLGTVKYFVPTEFRENPDGISTLLAGTYTVLTAGWQGQELSSPIGPPPKIVMSKTIDLIELEAFGETMEFSPVLASLRAALRMFESQIGPEIEAHANQRKSDLYDRENVFRSRSGDLLAHFKWAFSPDEVEPLNDS